jgi:hypothetical protein
MVMGVIEEILKNKEELIINFLKVVEGKETGVKVNLDDVKFKIGDSVVKLSGDVEFTFIPFKNKKR